MRNDAPIPTGFEPRHDWRRLGVMPDAEIEAEALSDADAQPLTDPDMTEARRTPQVRVIRRALGLSEEEFAERFQIPVGTLRDWEQRRSTRDQAARACLKVTRAANPKRRPSNARYTRFTGQQHVSRGDLAG